MRTLLSMRTERTSLWVSVLHLSFEDFFLIPFSLSHREELVIFYIPGVSYARTWKSDEQGMDRTATTTRVSHENQPQLSQVKHLRSVRMQMPQGQQHSAFWAFRSLQWEPARVASFGRTRTAGEMLPEGGNSIAPPLLFPYKSKVAHLAVLLVPNYLCATSFC